jgi:hypothetical protein
VPGVPRDRPPSHHARHSRRLPGAPPRSVPRRDHGWRWRDHLLAQHPSGDATPSAEDIRITRQLVEAGRILQIEILDHVILGRGDRPFVSLRESGLVSFG